MKAQITRLASGSSIGTPIRAPAMPTSAPTELRASLRWCQASAISAEEPSFRAYRRVYQNMASLVRIDTTAATSASTPGTGRGSLSADRMRCTPSWAMKMPVISRTTASRMAATHSMRSWP